MMVKGTQKQVIHLKNPESDLFEEAFFVIKHTPRTPPTKRTMVEEASRILQGEAVGEVTQQKEAEKGNGFLCVLFFIGAILGATVSAILTHFL
jgi:hypothetical protein